MGYARSSPALTAAAEKGLKYGRRTGEIVQDEEMRFCWEINIPLYERNLRNAR